MFSDAYVVLLGAGFVIGGMSNPLYSLLLAYTNDYLEHEDMAAASGGLLFINGVGAIAGPLITGWMLGIFGPPGFWVFLAGLMFAVAGYAVYRMTQRPAPSVDDTSAMVAVWPAATAVAVETAQEVSYEAGVAAEEAGDDEAA